MTHAIPDWAPERRAELSLLLEVASTPKPGNVDRHREYETLRFEHFVIGAVGARPGLRMAADATTPIGVAFDRAVEGMSVQRGGNTQFGALLLVCPLVRTATVHDRLTPTTIGTVVDATTVDDAVGFYRAFDHVDVAVGPPPEGMADLDVRRGAEAEQTIRERELTLADIMALSADHDGVAAEWDGGFTRAFSAADAIAKASGPICDRAAYAFLELLAEEPDPFVATTHSPRVAESIADRAAALVAADPGVATIETFADGLVTRGINPGTTADLIAAGLFIALTRGLEV